MGILLSLYRRAQVSSFISSLSETYGIKVAGGSINVEDLSETKNLQVSVSRFNDLSKAQQNIMLANVTKVTKFDRAYVQQEFEVYKNLVADKISDKAIVRTIMRRGGVPEAITEFACEAVGDEEAIVFPVILHMTSVFVHSTPEEKLALVFSIIDRNGDGDLSPEELYEVVKVSTGEEVEESRLRHIVDQIFNVADSSKDRSIDFHEFLAHCDYIAEVLHLNAPQPQLEEGNDDEAPETPSGA